ncbi:hypothetical protein C8R43DRAFT_964782 [Mycena crocata]|nr:hypothetical protein C8R43DRAFT_964782 [Mycena crocata]
MFLVTACCSLSTSPCLTCLDAGTPVSTTTSRRRMRETGSTIHAAAAANTAGPSSNEAPLRYRDTEAPRGSEISNQNPTPAPSEAGTPSNGDQVSARRNIATMETVGPQVHRKRELAGNTNPPMCESARVSTEGGNKLMVNTMTFIIQSYDYVWARSQGARRSQSKIGDEWPPQNLHYVYKNMRPGPGTKFPELRNMLTEWQRELIEDCEILDENSVRLVPYVKKRNRQSDVDLEGQWIEPISK